MAAGSNSKISTVRVNSFGMTVVVTPDAANNWRWTNFISEGLEHKIEELMEQSIYGYPDEPPSHQGLTTAEGDIEFEPNPNAIGQFIRGAFGVHSSSVLVAAGSTGANSGTFAGAAGYRHIFTPRDTPFSDRCFLDPYQVLVYRDVGSAFVFLDAVFPSIEFMIEAGQLVKATAGTMARRVTRNNLLNVASLVNSGGRPWVWDMASVQIGANSASLAGFDNFESVTANLETPIEGVPLLDGTRFYGEMQKSDFRKTRFSGRLSFRDQTEYDAFIAYENRHLRITLTNVNSNLTIGNPASAFYPTLVLDFPAFKVTQYGVFVKDAQRITADFEGRAERSDAYGYAVQATLINIVSSY